jgi:predicted Zn-dependent peptidase
MSTINITTLDNGLRVITDSIESVQSVALGIWVGVGTRDENLTHNGVAHMVEHMLFKGTPSRSAAKIAEDIENVGGSMNAYTSREITSYHIHLLKNDAPLALEVLADMYRNSSFPDDEIEREREVILQEIGMCNDTPDDLIFDEYFEAAYPAQSFGAPILGRTDTVEAMSRSVMTDYVKRLYTAGRTVISAAGNIEHDVFVKQVESLFGGLDRDSAQENLPANYSGGEVRLAKDLEQSHFILGFQGLSRKEDDFCAAQALSTLLGSGMSSRLFQEVREKRGLVYSIFSFHSGYQDDGQFGIYAGTGPEKMDEIVPVICDEVLKVGGDVTDVELKRAKAQIKANLLMGRESMMSRADQHAKYMLFRDQGFDIENLVAQIDAVDLNGISRVAERIFTSTPTLAALGPLDKLESFDSVKGRLAA